VLDNNITERSVCQYLFSKKLKKFFTAFFGKSMSANGGKRLFFLGEK